MFADWHGRLLMKLISDLSKTFLTFSSHAFCFIGIPLDGMGTGCAGPYAKGTTESFFGITAGCTLVNSAGR